MKSNSDVKSIQVRAKQRFDISMDIRISTLAKAISYKKNVFMFARHVHFSVNIGQGEDSMVGFLTQFPGIIAYSLPHT